MNGWAALIRTRRRLKLVLGAMLLVGLITMFTVGGVWGLLSSELSNGGSSISTATLTLNNTNAGDAAATTLTQKVGTTTLTQVVGPQTTLTSAVGSTTLSADVGTTTLSQNVGSTTLSGGVGTTTITAAITTTSATTVKVNAITNFPAVPFDIQIDSEQMTVTAEGGAGSKTWTVTRGVNGTTAATHLNGATLNQVNKVTVSSGTSFPSSGNFTVLVGTEQMTVTGGQGTSTWTVTRGANGSTAATHASGAALDQITMTVASAASFPNSGNYTIQVDSEQLTVTGGQGTTTWTVTRAVNGTTAASHASGATVNATTLTVASAANFPSSGNYGIQIDSEQMTVTGGQGTTTWTVTRATNGTTAASHTSGTTVHPTTISVSSASGYPSSGNYTIQIDNEQLTVTGGQGTTTWTVTRAANGTSASTHSSGAAVTQASFTVNSAGSFPSSGNYSIRVGTETMTVTGGQGTTTWIVTRGTSGTDATAHSSGDTALQTSMTVNSASGFPSSGDYTVLVGSEKMMVTGGQGTTTWTVKRAVDSTSTATHSSGDAVSTSACSSIGGTGNVNTACDSLFVSSTAAENYPGNPVVSPVTILNSGSMDSSDLLVWMPSCLRGVTSDAPWASSTPNAPTFSGASATGGHLNGLNTYYYEITAVTSGVESVAGTEASYTTPVGTNTNQITLNWSAVSGASSYKVYRATAEGQEQLLASGIAGTSYTDSTATTPSGSPPTSTGSGNPCGQTTTLAGSINASQTSITVATDAGFPTSGNFTILIDGEMMTITGGQGTTSWTVTRGVNSTTASSHTSGATIKLMNVDAQLYLEETTANGTPSECWYPGTGAATTLNGAINNSQTSLTVASSSGFPSTPFTIKIDSELMTVTNVAGTTWTVTRARGGTSGAIHANGATVALTTCLFDGTYDLGLFDEYVTTLGTALDLGSGPTAQNSRYFLVGMQFPSAADSTLQGTTANFTLEWETQS